MTLGKIWCQESHCKWPTLKPVFPFQLQKKHRSFYLLAVHSFLNSCRDSLCSWSFWYSVSNAFSKQHEESGGKKISSKYFLLPEVLKVDTDTNVGNNPSFTLRCPFSMLCCLHALYTIYQPNTTNETSFSFNSCYPHVHSSGVIQLRHLNAYIVRIK